MDISLRKALSDTVLLWPKILTFRPEQHPRHFAMGVPRASGFGPKSHLQPS